MKNELSNGSLQELASMLVDEVKRASSNNGGLKYSCFPSKITFEEAYELEVYRRESKGQSVATMNGFRSNSKRFYLFLQSIRRDNLIDVTVEDIEDYLRVLRRGNLTGATINKHISTVRSLFKTLVQREMLEMDPTRYVELDTVIKKKRRILSIEEIKDIMLSFDLKRLTHFIGLSIFMLQNDIGCRVSELVTLRIEDLNLSKLEIKYFASKNKVEVITPISPVTGLVLKVYIKNVLKERRKGFLFVKTTNYGKEATSKTLSTSQIRRLYREAGERAGLDFILGTHTIRRTKITQHLMSGGDLASAKELVGHKDIRSTAEYAHFTDKALREKHTNHGVFNLMMGGNE